MGVLEQPASETFVHNVMMIRYLHHGDAIITSHKHDKQSQPLADVNVSPPKVGQIIWLFNVLHREMQTSGMLGFISKATTMET